MQARRISLVAQIAQLDEAAPVDYDPEDFHARGPEVDNETDMDTGGAREHYLEVGPSTLRNRLPSVAHPKYEGVRATRKQLLEYSDDGHDDEFGENYEEEAEDTEDGGESEDLESADGQNDNEVEVGGEGTSELSESEASEVPRQEEGYQNLLPQREPNEEQDEDMTSTLEKTREEDMKKGRAIKKQIALWEVLLDTRIRMQKSVVATNRLPLPSEMNKYLGASECRDSVSKLLNEASLLSSELFELQEDLLITNDIIRPPPAKRRKVNIQASIEDYPELFATATGDVAALEQSLHPYVLQTLLKWSSKVQAVAPSILLPSNRGAFLKGAQDLKSVVQLIDESLADHEKLLARTRVPTVKKPRVGTPPDSNTEVEDALDPEIFDDTDFYQKMLRNIIDARGTGSKNEDWMILQKQRKAKKKVDTRASKGRKLRYEVHEKLQNFMVPVPSSGAWHEQQVDELFASLLGNGFESVVLDGTGPQVLEDTVLSGFRVFG